MELPRDKAYKIFNIQEGEYDIVEYTVPYYTVMVKKN